MKNDYFQEIFSEAVNASGIRKHAAELPAYVYTNRFRTRCQQYARRQNCSMYASIMSRLFAIIDASRDLIAENGWGLIIESRGGVYKFKTAKVSREAAIREFSRREDIRAVVPESCNIVEFLHGEYSDIFPYKF